MKPNLDKPKPKRAFSSNLIYLCFGLSKLAELFPDRSVDIYNLAFWFNSFAKVDFFMMQVCTLRKLSGGPAPHAVSEASVQPAES